jgi:hypothetical protein
MVSDIASRGWQDGQLLLWVKGGMRSGRGRGRGVWSVIAAHDKLAMDNFLLKAGVAATSSSLCYARKTRSVSDGSAAGVGLPCMQHGRGAL